MTPDTRLACDVRPSPNFDTRSGEGEPSILLLHYTGMGTGDQALDWLCREESKVSSHYLVHEDGRILQLVEEAHRAWHAGEGSWRGKADVNSRSIGIEIVNGGHSGGLPAYPEEQIASVVSLCRDILSRHRIVSEFVLAHSDIAPARKEDPGEHFPWRTLHEAGIGHLVEPAPLRGGRFFSRGDSGEPVAAFQAMLAAYGYGVEIDGVFDEATRLAVVAFQRHFRPARVDGVVDTSTVETLHTLLRALDRSPFEGRGDLV
ncbi:N-acetylmuramoyl-L-alanine amidase [Fulvimarina endophytica]|uniref:N-acetylmuramoyl-L-alanine amidase n=1 Tax=Fulvimarina endophytica TaxID=2293836 RepID=A0A371X184_9HYPH|nr:N-acetylmuramoyl-L-alanine amidase [Fulvimarina endophytica]RFC62794.1 N-acetylmuramoyl-L-alanine amidase [Fulvimarina endophytica]